jgi:hypothetical protein
VYFQLLLASGTLCCGWYFYVYRKIKNKEIDRLKNALAKSKENDLQIEIEEPAVDAKSLTFENLTADNPLAVKSRSMSVDVLDKTAPESDQIKLQSQHEQELEQEIRIKTLKEENERLTLQIQQSN